MITRCATKGLLGWGRQSCIGVACGVYIWCRGKCCSPILRAPELADFLEYKLIPKGNLLNRHSHKYSGLANSKVVSIHPSAEGSQIVIAKIKADAKPNQVNLWLLLRRAGCWWSCCHWREGQASGHGQAHRSLRWKWKCRGAFWAPNGDTLDRGIIKRRMLYAGSGTAWARNAFEPPCPASGHRKSLARPLMWSLHIA